MILGSLVCLSQEIMAQDLPPVDWDELNKTKPWTATEAWEPVPPVISPGEGTNPPSDAIILFNGHDLRQWQKPQVKQEGLSMTHVKARIELQQDNYQGNMPEWVVENGAMVVNPGSGPVETKAKFGDIQLHIEWKSPVDEGKEGQGYSNSGIFLMGLYEVQVLNSYQNTTYANGQAGSVYKQHIPLVNASLPPGQWQEYDIVFKAPRFKSDGTLQEAARVTVLHNGVLILNNVEIKGPTVYIGEPYYVAHQEKLPIRLQDHSNPVQFRNIWVREL